MIIQATTKLYHKIFQNVASTKQLQSTHQIRSSFEDENNESEMSCGDKDAHTTKR